MSRILGFLRDILFARLFGTQQAAEAFVVAFRIPNLLRDLVGEGAMNAAIVPVLTEERLRHRVEFWQTCRIVISVMGVLLVAITMGGILLSPLIVRCIAPGFSLEPERLTLAIQLTRWLFPYIAMMGLVALAMGILNTFDHFLVPALTPALLNVMLIAAMLWLCPGLRQPITGLVVAVLAAGLLQLSVHLPVLARYGWRPGWRWDPRHPSVRQIARLMAPRIVGSSVYQLSAFVDTIFASLGAIVGIGGLAAIYYANRLVQLPLALFGVAMTQAALPTLSRQAAQGDRAAFLQTLRFALSKVWRILLPAAVGLLILSEPIIRIIFQRGAFDAYSTTLSAYCLWCYALGLLSFGWVKILVSAFHALQDTATPVKGAAIALVVNVLLNSLLIWPLKIGGLALSTTIASTINGWYLTRQLQRRLGPLGLDQLGQALIGCLISALAMGGVIGWLYWAWLTEASGMQGAILLCGTIVIGIASYFVSLGVFERWIFKPR